MIPFPDKKYNIIYADPAWSYQAWKKNAKGAKGLAEHHYNTMSLEEICNLPVKDIAAKECVLFMWVTYPHLHNSIKVIESWGFKYKTVAFTWVKRNKNDKQYCKGLGYWTKANAEICLLATRGTANKLVIDKSVGQIIDSLREKHSKKPDEARKRIVQLLGDIPRIELFARESTDGWDVWGNEV